MYSFKRAFRLCVEELVDTEVAINVSRKGVWIVTLLKVFLKLKFRFIYSRKFLVNVSSTRLEYIPINLYDQNVLENDYKQNEKNDV